MLLKNLADKTDLFFEKRRVGGRREAGVLKAKQRLSQLFGSADAVAELLLIFNVQMVADYRDEHILQNIPIIDKLLIHRQFLIDIANSRVLLQE